jgi:hypothetical protein
VLSDSPDEGGIEDVAAKKLAGGGAADEGAGVRAGDDPEQHAGPPVASTRPPPVMADLSVGVFVAAPSYEYVFVG